MTILIKKYKNRRLYDTALSSYITFEHLKDYVINNQMFEVKDSTTGKDLTNITLIQILLEMENGSTLFLPQNALRNLIRLANHPLQQTQNTMLEQFFSSLENMKTDSPLQSGLKVWEEYMENLKNTFNK